MLDWVESRSDLDPVRIGLWGVSLGGYYAPRAAAFDKRVKACISLSGPFDWSRVWEALPGLTKEAFRVRAKCATQEDARTYGRQLLLWHRAQSRAQLFIVTGKLEPIVPWRTPMARVGRRVRW